MDTMGQYRRHKPSLSANVTHNALKILWAAVKTWGGDLVVIWPITYHLVKHSVYWNKNYSRFFSV